MKTVRLFVAIATTCFALGLGLSLVVPTDAAAGPDPCNSRCFIDFHCGGHPPGAPLYGTYTCPYGYVATFRCYAYAMMICDFLEPNDYNCRCVQTGCTMPC